MQASIIISYYKNLSTLELILRALDSQSAKNHFEVIVSEDDNDTATVDLLNSLKAILHFPIIHISQTDSGFRKCIALNHSIESANTDFLIFIDGDCIPHKKFVASYLQRKTPKTVLYGRRVMLSESISKKIHFSKNISLIHLFNLIAFKCKRIEEGIYFPLVNKMIQKTKSNMLLGCNMGINKADLLAINGFDEDYLFPGGGEDSDIEWRLKKIEGIKFTSMKFVAIVYHLYHPERFATVQQIKSTVFMNKKINDGNFFCKNGLTKIAS